MGEVHEYQSYGYVNNILLVFFSPDADDEDVAAVVAKMNGTIVGRIASLHQYQIQIEPMEYDDLYAYSQEVSKYDGVNYAQIDSIYSFVLNDLQIPNDPWKDTFQGFWGVNWNEDKPSGLNWWIEAVKVPSAWAYSDKMQPINVGVADNGFDINHEDLSITVINSVQNNLENHGTHVSGIIGATINNKTGISGILEQVNLYGVDCYDIIVEEEINANYNLLLAGIETCLEYGCKVVNMSSGYPFE